ncbi:MAG: PEP/pyruvate-binding domain-containing protein [Pirellulales bacterium]|nr:PEP/pyruvate-binding domain-containing protein [Thermoguttaceae bacterium]MDD4786975.1 PEP/pyruvate-binding domain-containing protein [Pirellulales bacterium]MDI9443583.1 PEP/pyruvate-binding domain-containing protein [Planctomycetota bacterium]NLZ00686.1 pyruvate, phosphate dikinase [Pirellulaceae bacterium]
MVEKKSAADDLIGFYREREKELECLYRLEEILAQRDASRDDVFHKVAETVPCGWQHPHLCWARITIGSHTYQLPGFVETPQALAAEIVIGGKKGGEIRVCYTRRLPEADEGPFLRQEKRLLQTIADRLGAFIRHQELIEAAQGRRLAPPQDESAEWRVVLNLLHHTDRNLFARISEKMLNHLCWSGVADAERLRRTLIPSDLELECGSDREANKPCRIQPLVITDRLSSEIFGIAADQQTSEQILANLRKWIQDDKLGYLARVSNRNVTLAEVLGSLRRFREMSPEGTDLSPATRKGLIVSLIRRFLSRQLDFIRVAKESIEIRSFFEILERIVYPSDSHGQLGGKSAGLFLAQQIVRKWSAADPLLANVKFPRSWYITTDALLAFLRYNNLDEVMEQKYRDLGQVRREYPHVVQTFKNSRFPPEIVRGLSMILDELAGAPLIVRSSSLLEDSQVAAFSGKYKSLFLANQGSKPERLDALLDAIAEVYASTYSPDPIEYRAERGLLDFSEEMGIVIQEVVGTRVGDYFLPAFAGVAFSSNELPWSPRIHREDGLLRMVPGLGTRAVDRVSNDYPILVAPGQPGLRVNVAQDEVLYYAPKKIDAINLKTNTFETVEALDLVRKHGAELPLIHRMVSIYDGAGLRRPAGMNIDFQRDDLVFTFDGLIHETPLPKQIHGLLRLLEGEIGRPVDIEFAHDGQDLYLLQCRAQSSSPASAPAPIPKDIPAENLVFTANRYVSSGCLPAITHLVYVDPLKYTALPERDDLLAVGRAVSRLNKLLPKRQFILMGPGRWGSRGDIQLGVRVTYSDINNTAALVEIARRKGDSMPEVSFGTHFFQDLVESRICYLPLFPDEEGAVFNERFLLGAPNLLPAALPEFARLADALRVIDVGQASGGKVLQVLMNADLGEAVGLLAEPSSIEQLAEPRPDIASRVPDRFWLWRFRIAEHIASQLDPQRYGVAGFYVAGSTQNATAGPASDIDIIIHFRGTPRQRADLLLWLEGWSLCLDEMNYLRTGYRSGGLLDVHLVTDEDIANKTSFAVKINSVNDPAQPLPLKKRDAG